MFLKAYTLIELDQLEATEPLLLSTLAMAPKNAEYYAELEHIYQTQGRWERALQVFEAAEEAADIFSPEDRRLTELSRAKRGIGFNLIELDRLNEAEAKFRECLALDPDDASAKNELLYIEDVRYRMLNGPTVSS